MSITNGYVTLNDLKARQSIPATVDAARDVYLSSMIEAASRWIEEYCHRHFYSLVATRKLTARWTDQVTADGLISVTTLKTDEDDDGTYEVTWSASDYQLEPSDAPLMTPHKPYGRVRALPSGDNTFPITLDAVEIVGVWGYSNQTFALSTLTAGINSSVTTVPVADGTLFSVGHIARVDSEDIAVDAIAVNNLTVRRGMNGTTAASHLSAAAVSVYQFGALGEACMLLAARLWKRKDTILGVSATTALGQLTIKAPEDKDILALLEPYRRTP